MRILAIETSCDETSMALVEMNHSTEKITIHGHFTASQAAFHAQFGGVFPKMAKLEHIKAVVPLFTGLCIESQESLPNEFWQEIKINEEKLNKVKSILHREESVAKEIFEFSESNKFPVIDFISVTSGPGLEPALWVGINFARALGSILDIPVVGENHMLGHMYSALLPNIELHKEIELNPISENFLTLLVSGGHTEILKTEKGKHVLLGSTLDDAVGEAFDKVARLMNMDYPGGPLVSKCAQLARERNIAPIDLPRPMLHSGNYEFSYSGLKTAVMYHLRKNPINNEDDKLALCLGFENAAIEVLVKKITKAMNEFGMNNLMLGGGVAANTYLRSELEKSATKNNFTIHYPLMGLTGDNALMIALASIVKYSNQKPEDESDTIKANGMLKIA
jgi:N6-L-threonylcarbamoyladenine synthase